MKATLVTCRSHGPTLLMNNISWARSPNPTGPKSVVPVTRKIGAGASPDRVMVAGPAGSSETTVSVALLVP